MSDREARRGPVGLRPGLEGRGDRRRPAQGRRGARRVEGRRPVPLRRALVTGDMVPPPRRCEFAGPRSRSSRSSAATRAPASSWRSAPASRTREARRPRVGVVRPVRAVAAATARPVARTCATWAPARSAAGMITDGTRRHHLDGEDRHAAGQARHVRRAHVRGRGVGDQGRRRPAARRASPSCRAASPPAGARPSRRADVQPGDTVVVVGIGGIGINAVQGARMAGAKRIIAVDPVEFKREKAMEFGATHTSASMEEAHPRWSPS